MYIPALHLVKPCPKLFLRRGDFCVSDRSTLESVQDFFDQVGHQTTALMHHLIGNVYFFTK